MANETLAQRVEALEKHVAELEASNLPQRLYNVESQVGVKVYPAVSVSVSDLKPGELAAGPELATKADVDELRRMVSSIDQHLSFRAAPTAKARKR